MAAVECTILLAVTWLFAFGLCDIPKITEDPQSVNASVRDIVSFTCMANGTKESPSWNIDGVDFFVSELPSNMDYSRTGHQLIVNVITSTPNRSTFYCFYVVHTSVQFERIKSKDATLFCSTCTGTATAPRTERLRGKTSVTSKAQIFAECHGIIIFTSIIHGLYFHLS
jgi:hypothetical protein